MSHPNRKALVDRLVLFIFLQRVRGDNGAHDTYMKTNTCISNVKLTITSKLVLDQNPEMEYIYGDKRSKQIHIYSIYIALES